MNKEKTIEVLNSLIQINNDRIEGYETASKETEEHDLKALFARFEQTSKRCRDELQREVLTLGGTPLAGTKLTGKFFRVWMDVKAVLTGKDRKAILNSCEYGEDVAVATYTKAYENNPEDLSVDMRTLIMVQHGLIKADHDKVKTMLDMLVEQEH